MSILFDQLDYRDYLLEWMAAQPNKGRGLKKKIAEFLGCHSSYVSQVLNKDTHLSLEQAFKLNPFLQHSSDESDYFVLQVQYQRAGTRELQTYFQKKMEAIHQKRLVLKNRLKSDTEITEAQKTRYYSAWYYAAIRLLVNIPEFQTKDALLAKLKIPLTQLNQALDFLIEVGLIEQKEDHYISNNIPMHLGNDSPLITKHHTNWRLKAMAALDTEQVNDLHFSAAITLSQQDMVKIKSMIVGYISEMQAAVSKTKDETLCCLNIDFFEL